VFNTFPVCDGILFCHQRNSRRDPRVRRRRTVPLSGRSYGNASAQLLRRRLRPQARLRAIQGLFDNQPTNCHGLVRMAVEGLIQCVHS
jgi:hypothetical protein